MKYLNLGCGNNYIASEQWTNIDFISHSKDVRAHNLIRGIPFNDNTYDLVYHSHVLEHFTKEDAVKFIEECFRVLKPGGIIRIAIPDLEKIVREYLTCLEEGIKDPDNQAINLNYQWIMLEMYDQTVRNYSGGKMGEFLIQDDLINEDFVFGRIGEEGRSYRYKTSPNNPLMKKGLSKHIISFIKQIKNSLFYWIKDNRFIPKAYKIGRFRLSGEIHLWMYDTYSISALLKTCGGRNIQKRDAFTSYIKNWADFCLDGKDSIVRKPDSIFIEAVK